MTSIDLLRDLIEASSVSNHADHLRIEKKLADMEFQVTSIRLWRAKVLGMSAAISCLMSATAVALGNIFSWVK